MRFISSECCPTRLVKNAPDGFSHLEGKYVLKVRKVEAQQMLTNPSVVKFCFKLSGQPKRDEECVDGCVYIRQVLKFSGKSTSGNFSSSLLPHEEKLLPGLKMTMNIVL